MSIHTFNSKNLNPLIQSTELLVELPHLEEGWQLALQLAPLLTELIQFKHFLRILVVLF